MRAGRPRRAARLFTSLTISLPSLNHLAAAEGDHRPSNRMRRAMQATGGLAAHHVFPEEEPAMHRIVPLVLVAGALAAPPAPAQQAGDATEVLQQARAALGADKLAAVRTLVGTGRAQRTGPGGEAMESDFEVAIALSRERGQDSWTNLLLVAVAYFT
jgi:hypothetical protein